PCRSSRCRPDGFSASAERPRLRTGPFCWRVCCAFWRVCCALKPETRRARRNTEDTEKGKGRRGKRKAGKAEGGKSAGREKRRAGKAQGGKTGGGRKGECRRSDCSSSHRRCSPSRRGRTSCTCSRAASRRGRGRGSPP